MFKMLASRQREADGQSMHSAHLSRRKFLGVTSAVAGSVAIAACGKDDDDGVDLGSGDVGILNYAYALEQLEAEFYRRVIASPFSGMTPAETAYLTDIRDHEIAHREFFRLAIGAANATPIPNLEVNFGSINFGDRSSVLNTAIAFEDLGVAAYNGAGKLITNGDYLVIAGKIVSVEARHAALVRDLLANGSFAATTDMNGMDPARTPSDVLRVAGAYISTKINASHLPTS
jgi:rubrerythrin